MPLRQSFDNYYTASQAMKAMGVTEGMFYNFIRNGDLEGIKLPGRKQSVYEKSKVNQLARELKAFVITKPKITSTFARATEEDISDCAKISDTHFNGLHFDVEKQKEWLRKNPDTTYVVKHENKVVGYVLLLPLEADKIERILKGQESSLDIVTSEVKQFEKGKVYNIYMASIAISSSVTLVEKRIYGARLVGGVLGVLVDLGKRGVILETITARSSKPDGIRLLRGIGFTEVLSTTGMKNFTIDVEKSGIKEIVEYKQALKQSGAFAFPQDLSELQSSVLPESAYQKNTSLPARTKSKNVAES